MSLADRMDRQRARGLHYEQDTTLWCSKSAARWGRREGEGMREVAQSTLCAFVLADAGQLASLHGCWGECVLSRWVASGMWFLA